MKKELELILRLEELLLTKTKHEMMCAAPDLDEVEEKIVKIRRELPSELLSRYDRLATQFADVITMVEDQVCQGCHERISRRLSLQVERSDTTMCCEHCGRFLISTENAPKYLD